MQVRCKVCGGTNILSKAHKDYQRIAKHSSSPFICEKCCARIQAEMRNQLEYCKKK